jgi:hypothetical protein
LVVFVTKLAGAPMDFSGKNESGRSLRTNPEAWEVLRKIARLPDLDDLRAHIETTPAPNNGPEKTAA